MAQDICDSSDYHPLLWCTKYSKSTDEAREFPSFYILRFCSVCMCEVLSAYGMCKNHLRSLSSMKKFTDSGDTEMLVELARTLKISKEFSTAPS